MRFWIPTRLSIWALWAQVHQPGKQAESEIVLHPRARAETGPMHNYCCSSTLTGEVLW